MINIFIPSYGRADNIKTAKYFKKIGWDVSMITVFIDSEAIDYDEYLENCQKIGCNLEVFNIEDARNKYDYVHRPSKSRRSAGQARNMFYDYAIAKGINVYCVIDDDTNRYETKKFGKYKGASTLKEVVTAFDMIADFILKKRIGIFGVSQTGDYIGGANKHLLKNKVMNTTFVNPKYINRGERGVQDDDTSMFVGVMNMGLFTGQIMDGPVLNQTQSATVKGGLTELYNECKLLNKALVTVIQYPSAIIAERQKKNGGRLHHRIKNKYLYPRLIRTIGVDNIAWDSYQEDSPFSNEPKRKQPEKQPKNE